MLKPQDIVILLKLVCLGTNKRSRFKLAQELGMSAAEVHAGIKRAVQSGLLNEETEQPRKRNLLELLIHGVPYVYPPQRGTVTIGIPTAYAAPPLASKIVHSEEERPVWPYEHGKVRGYALEPLYPSVPKAAIADKKLYELLALVDAMRSGRAREKKLAAELLEKALNE